ncbi:sensor histidine kinase [Fibrella sp. WM1]|uniref:ATP-binding protein n=1 Tax=Fibrella musci TaxID=3242485 RepID=UPI0035214078
MNWGKAVLFVLVVGCLGRSGYAQTDTSAIEREKAALDQLLSAEQYTQAARSYEKLADLYHQVYGYNKYTIDAYLNAISLYTRQGDSLGSYNFHMSVGNYYTQDYFMQSYAEDHLTKALVFFQRTNNRPKIIECRLGIANMVAKKEPTPVSLITELKAIEHMSAQYKQVYFQTYAQNLLADTYLRLKRPDSAYHYAGLSLESAKQIKVNWLVALNYFYLGIVEQFRNQHRKAIDYYQKSYAIAEVEKNLTTLRQLSRHTAESYAYLNDHKKAYFFAQRALDFTNQFYYSEQTKSIRLQELNSQIKSLAVEKRLAEEQSQHQRMVNYMLIAVLIVSILGVVALVFMRRQQKLITHQQSVIAQQQIRQLELKSLRAMIEGQESERSRIARDLHDGLGIQLSRIKLFVEAHDEQLPHAIKEPLNQFLDEACTETRLISNDLRPYALSTFGLIPALEDLVQKLNLVEGPRLTFEHYGDLPPLGDEASVMIYRVIQELLNNALKHAQADAITIQLMANDETLLISVDDDGRGGDFAETASRGNGIANIRSRIDYLGGQVMWQSESQRGTSVMISLPMPRLSQLLTQEV